MRRWSPLIAAGTISTPVAAAYRFDQVTEAITKATQSGGKVLFSELRAQAAGQVAAR